MGLSPGQDDPLNELMKPPADETPAQTMARRKRELDAQHVSDRIDDQLKKERSRAKKEKVTKVLLLGQAESGKSTTLKNFRLRYSPDDWEKERNGWRAVVQLNIVRSISLILRVLEAEFNGEPVAEELQGEDTGLAMDDVSDSDSVQLTDWHQMLMIRLAPLRSVEVDLKKRLGTGDYTQTIRGPLKASPFEDDMSSRPTRRMFEASVRSWQDLLDPGRHKMAKAEVPVEQDAITTTIAGCKDDMKSLWSDKAVRSALHRRKIRLPDSAGFFLNDLERIATRNYTVSDNDIVRSRLRTVGIQEYSLKFQKGWEAPGATGSATWEWRMYDVGGCRTLRSAWLPYFENVDAIIFLTPVSVFDENLWEDPNVNRLQDSTELWTAICSSKLLARTQIIHFLNKCDLLHRKLKRGAALNRYLPSYGDRPNEVSSVVKYLREKFKEIQKRCSPQPRVAYIYPTTVTDTEATAITLDSVRDGVLRENLASSHFI